jgi:DHA2 family multidrug resistance protein
LVAIGFGSVSIILEQGDRLDWFNSQLIATLCLVAAVTIVLFFMREVHAEVPFIRLDLFKHRNFSYSAITLILFLVVALSASVVPINYLTQVQGYRPLQAHLLTLEIAAAQLVMLPATALLLDQKWADSRWVSAIGFCCILASCIGKASLTPTWNAEQFLFWQALDAIGFPLVAMPLLMMATNVLSPEEGPFASAMINAPRAIAEALGVWLLTLIQRWRGGLHRTRLIEAIGDARLRVVQSIPVPGASLPALTPTGRPRVPGALETLNQGVEAAVTTLTTIDTFIIMGGIVVFMMVILAVLPERTYPPRMAVAAQ